MKKSRPHPFRDSDQDIKTAGRIPDTPQTRAPSYRLAFADQDFLTREELRPVRLQLELLKTEMIMDEMGVKSTIVMFGGARIPDEMNAAKTPEMAALVPFYHEAQRFAAIMTQRCLDGGGHEGVICTGGGPGVMEAGNRGAAQVGGRSVGLNIVLPHEQAPNAYVTPELSVNFHYFAIRKMHFLMRARAICVFPGGFGTLDEMFETLTLIQTKRMARVPVVLFGTAWWQSIINWQALAQAGVIAPEDLNLFVMVDTAEDAIDAIDAWPFPKEGA
ncbi:MAG: LOG family protein [Cypionkella sp.]|nr:LOG family protein [Cypionkella sp.]